jgi:non-homologous end joining protein Ku
MSPTTLCPIGVKGSRGLRHRHRGSSPNDASLDGDQSPAATRVTLRPHDPATGEEIEKREVVKGYEYARGEFVTFTAEAVDAGEGEQ